jgi:IS5 family transposase
LSPRRAARKTAVNQGIRSRTAPKRAASGAFGYKGRIGVDEDSGQVHHVEVTGANVSDVSQTPKLPRGKEKKVRGDAGYVGAEKREEALTHNDSGEKIKYTINRRPSSYRKNKAQSRGQIRRREREKSSVRAKVEHVFAVIKGQFGYRKTRYRGLRKQTAKLNVMFALANLVLADRPCLAQFLACVAPVHEFNRSFSEICTICPPPPHLKTETSWRFATKYDIIGV